MGKTVRLTEEQIRRFFGEGFGRRLLGEDAGQTQPLGAATYRGNLNKLRFDPGISNKGKNEDEKASLSDFYRGRMDQFNNSKMSQENYEAYLQKAQENPELNDQYKVDEIIRVIYDEIKSPVNIIDFLRIINKKITAENVKNVLDLIGIETILSGFIGLNAPDYVYYRLLNLTPEQLDNIEKKFGKNFKNWGTKCDGCGAIGWKTTVPTAPHDDAYTVFDFGATDDKQIGKSGESIKESAGEEQMPGFKVKDVLFSDLNILEMHHINGDPSDNSAYNIACLCPNCHTCIDSTGRGKSINFDLNSFIKNNGTINGDSILGKMSDSQVSFLQKRLQSGYYSDRTIASNIMYGEPSKTIEYTIDKKVDLLAKHLPPYYNGRFDPRIFKETLKTALYDAESFVKNHALTSDKLYTNIDTSNDEVISEGRPAKKAEKKVGRPFEYIKGESGFIYLYGVPDNNKSARNVSVEYKFIYSPKKDEAAIKITNQRGAGDTIIVINALGDPVRNEAEVSNIVDGVIRACFDAVNVVTAKPSGNKTEFAHNAKQGNLSYETPNTMEDELNPSQLTTILSLVRRFCLNKTAEGNLVLNPTGFLNCEPEYRKITNGQKLVWGENAVYRLVKRICDVYKENPEVISGTTQVRKNTEFYNVLCQLMNELMQ